MLTSLARTFSGESATRDATLLSSAVSGFDPSVLTPIKSSLRTPTERGLNKRPGRQHRSPQTSQALRKAMGIQRPNEGWKLIEWAEGDTLPRELLGFVSDTD